jgi:hypothetical protein
LQFTSDDIYWGTDSPDRENHIVRWSWSLEQKSILLTVPNPFYYSFQDSNQNLFYTTTIEGPNHKFSELWQICNGSQARKLIKWSKGGRKGHGLIQFAQGMAVPNLIAFTPRNLKEHHCEALVVELSR